ncbi:hypothetical protein ABGF48_03295 [Helcococcus bovis]|uniref:hypothetical protein n=1 Tax=Helcococcus bovis TaxID=3153252 RepID=UPI0038B7F761
MAKFKALRIVEDKKENIIIKKDEIIERQGKRADDFRNSGYFEELEIEETEVKEVKTAKKPTKKPTKKQ